MQRMRIPHDGLTRGQARPRSAGARLAGLPVLLVAAAVAAALLLVAGCGSNGGSGGKPLASGSGSGATVLGPVAAAKGAPVRIGMISDGKTPVSDVSIQGRVADATVKWLNEHRSGIGGRPIELVKCDDLADPGKGADCANRMIEENVAAVVVGETSVPDSVWQPLHAAHLPVMLYGSGDAALLTDKESTFVLGDAIFPILGMPLQIARDKGVKKVTPIVIDVPAALGVWKLAPPLFEQAGVALDLVTIPPGTADMTPQMQRIASGGPTVVFIVGTDAFCITALNGLRAVGFTGQVSGFSTCISDATRKAVPGEALKGMIVSATAPVGTDNPSTRLYSAVATTYGKNIDTGDPNGMAMFSTVAGFQTALEGISGDITPATITATIKAMPEKDLPGAGGIGFRCNGKANPQLPAVCSRGALAATLDAKVHPISYRALGSEPIPN
ncbi:ABC transporter substrate-binding protein [Pseudofrankia sp. BMG5.37]|nr:ABC transporter substrate-binding protein [Pseudofrankia sp. BMG5.37]